MIKSIFTILTSVSSIIVVCTTILTTFSKTRKWLHKAIFGKLEEKIDDQHKDLQQKLDEQGANLNLKFKRLEILNMIQHSPDEKQIICRLYDEYTELGGNSYVTSQFEKWKEQYCSNEK